MGEDTVVRFQKPDARDALTELLRAGAQRLLQQAVQAELEEFLGVYAGQCDEQGRAAVVRNGHLPQRQVLTGIGPVGVQVPKVRSRTDEPVVFRSSLVPPYVRKAKSVEAALPWLYLRGMQRLLWASTSAKNPSYPDLMYVEPLIGPNTINTMPEKTIAALEDHGRIADDTIERDVGGAEKVMVDLERLGISFDQVTAQLESEGVHKFIEAFDAIARELAGRGEPALTRSWGAQERKRLEAIALKLRRWVIRMTTEAGSGHPTSCLSCADLAAALFFSEMRWDPNDPHARNVDQLVLSKGHAAPILWAALSEAGAISEDPLTLRRIDSSLEGHPTPRNPWVRVATGSLGQGLSAANGIALANRLDGIEARIFCLFGDGECSEGSVWGAAQFAALQRLANVTVIVDANGLGQSGPAPYGHDSGVLARRFQAFGWRTMEIDGHDMAAILALDGDVNNSTGLQEFAEQWPERFLEGFIAEQNMIGTALGLAVSGKIPYAATFACFLTRAYDFIRMAQYSRPRHLILCGSHCCVSIGEDGPSQMGLEDIAMFRALIESTILYPTR